MHEEELTEDIFWKASMAKIWKWCEDVMMWQSNESLRNGNGSNLANLNTNIDAFRKQCASVMTGRNNG